MSSSGTSIGSLTIEPVFLTVSATLIGAFLGAGAAQYFSHRLSMKREREKYYKDVYLNFFSPLILDITTYYDIRTAFRRHHDVKSNISEEKIREVINKKINNSIKTAPPSIVPYYAQAMKYDYWEDMSGFYAEIHELELYAALISEAAKTLKKTGIQDKKLLKKLKETNYFYSLWIFFTHNFGSTYQSAIFMTHDFYFDQKTTLFKRFQIAILIKSIIIENNSLVNRLVRRVFIKDDDVNLLRMIELICSDVSGRKELLSLCKSIRENETSFIDRDYLRVFGHGILVFDLNAQMTNNEIYLNFNLHNNSDYIRTFSNSDFFLKTTDSVIYRCEESFPFINGSKDVTKILFENESTIVHLKFSLGENFTYTPNNISLGYIDGNKSVVLSYNFF